MKVALVHDQLAEFGGAERVLVSLKQAFPEAPVYTSFVNRKRLGMHYANFANWEIHEGIFSKFPFFKSLYSPLRFLLPIIWSSFDLSAYDVVICSSSWGMCKGVSLRKNNENASSTRYFCYLHTPPRYLYGYDENPLKKYWAVRLYALIVNHFLRQYDYKSSQTIDEFIFNSEEIRGRSLKFYRRDGQIVHPPIKQVVSSSFDEVYSEHSRTTQDKQSTGVSGGYYLTVSRLTPTKHIDLLIKVANEMKLKLKIVGTGVEEESLKKMAGDTIEFLGSVDDEKLGDLYANAKAFLYASVNEDFGMVPVEAMSYGTPVIALSSGGVKETVIDGLRGVTFSDLSENSLKASIIKFEKMDDVSIQRMRNSAIEFAKSCSEDKFIDKIKQIVFDK